MQKSTFRRIAGVVLAILIALALSFFSFRVLAHRLAKRRAKDLRKDFPSADVAMRFDSSQRVYAPIHGLNGSAYEYDVLHRKLVEPHWNFWTKDLPGHGDARKNNRIPVTFEAIAEAELDALIARMDAHGVEKVVGGGHSLGGGLALQMAKIADQRGRQVFSHLVLYEPVRTGKDIPLALRRAFIDGLYPLHLAARKRAFDEDMSALAVEVIHQGVKRAGHVARDRSRIASEENMDTKKFSNAAADRYAWVQYILRYLEWDGEKALAGFPADVPVLIVQGELTKDDAVHQGEAFFRMLPDVTLVTFEGVAHQGLFREPERFINEAIRFVEIN